MCDCMNACGNVLAALITRILFVSLSLVVFLWIFINVEWNYFFLGLPVGLLLLLIETVVTLRVRKGREYRRFCPSVFFYLCSMVPCIWVIEQRKLNERLDLRDGLNQTNLTIAVPAGFQASLVDHIANASGIAQLADLLRTDPQLTETLIESLFLYTLVIGRWLLPSALPRYHLSQLLLAYTAIAGDSIELFETFEEPRVKYDRTLMYIILGVWSFSLLQFPLVLIGDNSSKFTLGSTGFDEEKEGKKRRKQCYETESCGIFITMLMQDAPFLALRLVLMIEYDVLSGQIIFFAVKNVLLIVFTFYRLFSITFRGQKKAKKRKSVRNTGNNQSSPPWTANPRVSNWDNLPLEGWEERMDDWGKEPPTSDIIRTSAQYRFAGGGGAGSGGVAVDPLRPAGLFTRQSTSWGGQQAQGDLGQSQQGLRHSHGNQYPNNMSNPSGFWRSNAQITNSQQPQQQGNFGFMRNMNLPTAGMRR